MKKEGKIAVVIWRLEARSDVRRDQSRLLRTPSRIIPFFPIALKSQQCPASIHLQTSANTSSKKQVVLLLPVAATNATSAGSHNLLSKATTVRCLQQQHRPIEPQVTEVVSFRVRPFSIQYFRPCCTGVETKYGASPLDNLRSKAMM